MRRVQYHTKHQTGAGLLTALILLMLITSIIATIAVVVHYDIRRHRMLRHAETAQGLMDGAMKLALESLSQDALGFNGDSYEDTWMISPTYPVEGGYVHGEVRPLSSSFNLYALMVKQKNTRENYSELFRRLCAYHGVPQKDVTRILNTITRNQANLSQPMDALSLLPLAQRTRDMLAKHVYYYPVLDGFNVNLLDESMWQVIMRIEPAKAQVLANRLKAEPVRDIGRFMTDTFSDNRYAKSFYFSTETRFFEIITEAKVGDMIRANALQVFREGGGQIKILQRRTVE